MKQGFCSASRRIRNAFHAASDTTKRKRGPRTKRMLYPALSVRQEAEKRVREKKKEWPMSPAG